MLRPTGTVFPVTHAASGPAIAEVRVWNEAEFQHSEAQWQNLLHRSIADPLFMSWSWQWSWWLHHASLLKSKLWLLAAYSLEGELVGLAPLHLRRAAHRKPLSAMRLETIGSTWRHQAGAYSEYLDFVVDTRFENAFIEALADVVLRDHRWSDLIIANCKKDGVAARFVRKYLDSTCYVREADPVVAQLTVLPESFAHYVKALRPGVRRKLWNQRTRLANPQLTAVSPDRLGGIFDQLNDFHLRRWGARLFVGSFRAFHLDFARQCAERGLLRMSALNVAGNPVSVIYNVRIGATEYNIQSGFDSTVSGISPGYLHFGFCMEEACGGGVKDFDFLAGDGRSRDYKRDFITQKTELLTFQCIRTRPLAWLYKKYDRRLLHAVAPCAAAPTIVLDCGTGYANAVAEVARLLC
jgi:hypothetical protein